jgi:cytochrome P450
MHVPKGARVGFVMHPIHHDEDFYPDPNRYDPFRFSRPHEAYDAELLAKKPPGGIDEPGDEAKVGKDLKRVLAFKNQSLVTVGDTFLPFGHGKHACPGRFFASHEIKLMLAYIVQNYDIKPMAERIPSYRFLEVAIPPPWATIQIRRRKASV